MDTNKRATPATNAYTSQGSTQINTQNHKSQTHDVVRQASTNQRMSDSESHYTKTNIKCSQSKTENGNTFVAYSAEIADMA